jgi:DNA helicase-2/ATP-dependent DNA helicase PcrA
VLDFVAKWEKKATTERGELGELIEYLEYFREAHGSIALATTEEDAVRLMTAHSAKGLEFKHVFILRAYSPSFPNAYREPLVEFPRELRDPESLAPDDDKTLNAQEERRLFYVAMTRACDSLTFYAKQGTGKKDLTPPGFLRELLKNPSLRPWLRQREARPFQTEIFAQEAEPVSRTSEWLNLPPTTDLSTRLSASAVQSYERCPLQFKLEREWRIPGEVPAAMQYGATMHRVLKSFFDSVRFNRPMDEPALIAMFKADLEEAHLEDRYQHELYEKQGIEQLIDFLAATRRSPAHVLHTEEGFEIRLGQTTVVGRIDRIDRLDNGRVSVTDYKTGKPQSQEDADQSLQLSIYALAAQQKWGYQVDHLLFYNLQENTTVLTRREPVDLDSARNKVEDVAAKIAAGEFAAKPGFYCAFCAYANICPAKEKPIRMAPVAKIATTRN